MVKRMYLTNLDHEYLNSWSIAKKTCLFWMTSNTKPVGIFNMPGIHAEEILIESLKQNEIIQKTNDNNGTRVPITVFINNSPCHRCAEKLFEFLDEYNVSLKLYVTSLYNIRRDSCIAHKEKHVYFIKESEHKENVLKLQKLMHHEHCQINAFCREIWEQLLDAVKAPPKLLNSYSNTCTTHDRSRKEEDKRIKNDLTCIKDGSSMKLKSKY